MSIIDPTPAKPSVEQVADNVVAQMNSFWRRTADEFKRVGNRSFWNHPLYTPQEIAAAFRDRGVPIFQTSGIFQAALEAIGGVPVAIVPAGWTVTPNADGTVTLTPPPDPDPAIVHDAVPASAGRDAAEGVTP